MKKFKIQSIALLGAIVIGSLASCDRTSEEVKSESSTLENLLSPNTLQTQCSYVDGSWSSSAVLMTTLPTTTDTNFMVAQNKKIAALFGRTAPVLRFVNDPVQPSSTYNAISYSTGKIYFGYAIYKDAKAKGGDIVNAMILAHEYGHQLQYIFGLPSKPENTARPNELEADGFAGYYLRKPTGYNKTNFSEIAAAYNFAYAIGDNSTSDPDHHGTPAQRRSAVRLGFLLGASATNMTATSFDSNFFYYYNGVLNGTYRKGADSSIDPKLEEFMSQYINELSRISKGQMSDEEYNNL